MLSPRPHLQQATLASWLSQQLCAVTSTGTLLSSGLSWRTSETSSLWWQTQECAGEIVRLTPGLCWCCLPCSCSPRCFLSAQQGASTASSSECELPLVADLSSDLSPFSSCCQLDLRTNPSVGLWAETLVSVRSSSPDHHFLSLRFSTCFAFLPHDLSLSLTSTECSCFEYFPSPTLRSLYFFDMENSA